MDRTNNTLINTKIAAELTEFSQAYIRGLCASGKIKAIKVGTHWLLKMSALKDIKRQRKRTEHESRSD